MTSDEEARMPSERFDFANVQGHRLAALLDNPAREPRAYALFAHCFTCGKELATARRIAEGLTGLGIGVLRFDFTGLGGERGRVRQHDLFLQCRRPGRRRRRTAPQKARASDPDRP
jgi:predicted alpha/beta-hydrolase family hydrolase